MNTYVDCLKVKDRVDYETERYRYTSFTDNLFGEFGNVSVFDKKNCKCVFHATMDKAYTLEELKVYADGFEYGLQ